MVDWFSTLLAEQEVRGSNHATSVLETAYLQLLDEVAIRLKDCLSNVKSSKHPSSNSSLGQHDFSEIKYVLKKTFVDGTGSVAKMSQRLLSVCRSWHK